MPEPQTAEPTVAAASETAFPDSIGPYRILSVLGEGGMGIVYLAEQHEPIRRRVALKLIKHGMNSRHVLARFESERQALALMSHPGIARVLEAGSAPDGRPYFVMEHVAGLPITEYCDQRRLGVRERLALFVEVCEAVEHAHRRGILHRDLKPSNVLVGEQDRRPTAKVIDFGVAKAMSQRLTDKTVFTQHGMLIGTPEYMSPEQAGVTELEVDARTDVYSLGVLLYELLVGARPFDLRKAAVLEMLRVIREDEPPRPTTRISGLGATAEEIARRRHTDVRSLLRVLRGELEWITLRALEKEPARRYATASDLAADIGRYLESKPVAAAPAGTAYRLGKWARRHRAAVGLWALVVLLVVAGVTISALLHRRAERTGDAFWRGFLESVIATGSLEGVDALGESALERLYRKIETDPEGEIARLAYRAAARVRIDVPAFGLVSETPKVRMEFGDRMTMLLLPDSTRLLWNAEIETSWDEGPWHKALSMPWTTKALTTKTATLGDLLGSSALVTGPHRLAVRAQVARYPDLSPPNVVASPKAGIEPLEREIRDLGVFPIALYEAFPPDFPTAVVRDESAEAWFRIEAVRLVTTTHGRRAGKCLRFPWPGHEEREPSVVCLPPGDPPACALLVGFELEGSIRSESLPLAMRVSVEVPPSREPVATFDLMVSDHDLMLGPAWWPTSTWVENRSSHWVEVRSLRTVLRGLAAGPLPCIPDLPRGRRPIPGRVRFTPSRDLALATRRFDRYLGNQVEIPIEVSVVDVPATWTDEADWPARATE